MADAVCRNFESCFFPISCGIDRTSFSYSRSVIRYRRPAPINHGMTDDAMTESPLWYTFPVNPIIVAAETQVPTNVKNRRFFVIFSLTDEKLGERIAFRKGELSDDQEHNGIDHKIDQLDQYLVHSALPVYSVP